VTIFQRGCVALIAAFVLSGCGGAPSPTLPDGRRDDTVLPREDDEGLTREVHRLLRLDDLEAAESAVRRELERPDPAEPAAVLQLLLGEIYERRGQAAEAMLAFSTVGGRPGGSAVHSRAWDGIARLRRARGDERGAVRASMRAWDLATEDGRVDRTPALRHAIRELSIDEAHALERETRDLNAHDLLERVAPSAADDVREVTVSLLAPFSGRFQKFGEAFRVGARLALDERDAIASPDAVRIRVVERDSEESVPRATREARAAILEDQCVAIVGPLLSVTSASAGAVAQAYGVPILAPTATDPELAKIGPMVLTFDPAPAKLVTPLADFAINSLGARRFGVLSANDGTNAEFEREFGTIVRSMGGEVVESIAYEPDEKDFRRLIERLDDAAVDAVYIPGSPANVEALATQLDFYDFRRRILGNGGWTHPRVLDAGSLALEGAILAVEAADYGESDFMRHLSQTVWSQSGQEVSRFHVRGYQVMRALLSALDQGARLGEEIAETIRLRRYWADGSLGERIYLLTYRDGTLGPATWATGFDLTPIQPPDADPVDSPPAPPTRTPPERTGG
jgi:branched-chain amino acid transport system substrate-binding protein